MYENNCPSANAMAMYVEDSLKGRQLRDIIAHIRNCDECRHAFADAKEINKELEESNRSK